MTDGAVVVDKPAGLTSHDVVAVARRALQTRQVGHTGTLDPLATGVLVLLVGRATRLSQFLVLDEKEYVADIRLGVSTPTYDAEGLPAEDAGRPAAGSGLPAAELAWRMREALDAFRGTFLQTPPPFSAKKVDGRRAYEHARRSEPVDLKPVAVTLKALDHLPSDDADLVRLRIVVSSGFYVRSLAHDLGQRLGCGAHLAALRRTRVGRFSVEQAVPLDQLTDADLVGASAALSHLPAVTLSPAAMERVRHGGFVTGLLPDGLRSPVMGSIRLLSGSGTLVAIADARPDGLLQPRVVLV